MIRSLVSVVIETITTRFHCATGSLADDLGGTLDTLDRRTYLQGLIERIVVLDDENRRSRRRRPHPPHRRLLGCANVLHPQFRLCSDRPDERRVGFNINNEAFRREVLLAHPFDTRISRNGGCYFLFHQLRAAGARVLYEPRAVVAHDIDIRGLGFVRKHFDRGYDGVAVYGLDAGAVALVAIIGHRIGVDWLRLLRHCRQIRIPVVALPYFRGHCGCHASIEPTGGPTAIVASEMSKQET